MAYSKGKPRKTQTKRLMMKASNNIVVTVAVYIRAATRRERMRLVKAVGIVIPAGKC